MSEPALLTDFCDEMQRLAGVIEARDQYLPQCGGDETGGFRVDVERRAVYVLTYSEKGISEVVARNADRDVVLEQVFVSVTHRMATDALSSSAAPITVDDMTALTALPIGESRRRAETLHSNEAAIQFRLMDQLKPEWGQRQLQRNAERERQIQNFFDGDQP
ncbi:MAG: hypothetical protein ACOH1H_10520 [Brevundimonas sp.]